MLKGRGLPQSFKKSYYWSLSSKLYGEKKADNIIKKSILKLSEDEVEEVVVTGIKSSLKDAIEIKRNNVGVVDALTAED